MLLRTNVGGVAISSYAYYYLQIGDCHATFSNDIIVNSNILMHIQVK